MKNLITLFVCLISVASFGQADFNTHVHQYKVLPNSAMPPKAHNHPSQVSRTTGPCDTVDVLDYNTYNEVIANAQGITYNGSWNSATPQPYGQEITSLITINSADNQEYSYIAQTWDSLAFANYANASTYWFPHATSSVSLDSVGMFIGLAGDTTVADGKMTNDSLIFYIYTITAGVVSAVPVQTQVYTGYQQLAPFIVGTTPGFLKYAQITVGHQFAAGQGFGIGLRFVNQDTSSHLIMSFSYADSCGTITFQGQQFASPADPTPFVGTSEYLGNVGCSFWGEIDSTSPTVATTRAISNAFAYNITGIPANCTYVYNQNWEFLAFVTVTNTMGMTENSPLTLTCGDTVPVALRPTLSGDYAGATYQWTGGVHGSATTANTTVNQPGTYTLNATNNVGCTASTTVVAQYPGGVSNNVAITPPNSICADSSVTFTNASSSTGSGWTASWNMGNGSPAITTINATYAYPTASNSETVTLTMDSAGCNFSSSVNVTVANCGNVGFQNLTLDNEVSMVPNPSTGNLNITINGLTKNLAVRVYNVIGSEVKTFVYNDVPSTFSRTFDFSDLANGTYLVRFESGNQSAVKKLLIAK